MARLRSLHSFVFSLPIFFSIVVSSPSTTGEPAANPGDPAKEDLSRIDYPSLRKVDWEPRFIGPHETLESLFGADWTTVARFNRIDRRHTYPGMTIKVPTDLAMAREYTPMPQFYEPAKRYQKYILVSRTEQWLGAYEHGKLKFSVPAATGKEGTETPLGIFRVNARHRMHTSSLYTTDDGEEQYPMDYAFRFHIGSDNVSYWIHSRDLPGRPASHGCIGVYNEEMQKRMYEVPAKPELMDARKLYTWAVVDDYEDADVGELDELEDGLTVEVVGDNPVRHDAPLKMVASAAERRL